MQGPSLFHIVLSNVEVFFEIDQIVQSYVFQDIFVVFLEEVEVHLNRYLNYYVLKTFDQKLHWKNLVPWLREKEPANRLKKVELRDQ